ncbi:hypothetical protein [Vibrio cholerae]|nr:hypothetical protein [Vibrio cholerae]
MNKPLSKKSQASLARIMAKLRFLEATNRILNKDKEKAATKKEAA